MQARAGAIDELLASGALDDATGTAKDDITAELERMSQPERRRARAGPAQGRARCRRTGAADRGQRDRRAGNRHRRHRRRARGGAAVIVRILARASSTSATRTPTCSTRSTRELEPAVEAGDEAAFRAALAELLARCATLGEPAARRRAGAVRRCCCPTTTPTLLEEVRATCSADVDEGLDPRLTATMATLAATAPTAG